MPTADANCVCTSNLRKYYYLTLQSPPLESVTSSRVSINSRYSGRLFFLTVPRIGLSDSAAYVCRRRILSKYVRSILYSTLDICIFIIFLTFWNAISAVSMKLLCNSSSMHLAGRFPSSMLRGLIINRRGSLFAPLF